MPMKTASKGNSYALKTPCKDCPFRTDINFYLARGRAREIADSIRGGAEFHCHKTTVEGEREYGIDLVVGPNSKVCAGSMIIQAKNDDWNQMARIAGRLGLFDPTEFDLGAPVFNSFSEWVRERNGDEPTPTVTDPDSGEVLEFEHCGVVAEDCEDPGGYSMGGGVSDNEDPPTCNPLEDSCSGCGSLMCAACRATPNGTPGGASCVYCAEED